MTAVEKWEPPAAVMQMAGDLTREQVALVKRTVAVGTDDDELALFLSVANRTGLDPFTRQIHAVKRWNSREKRETMAIQVGIDGYRAVAARTGLHAGTEDATFEEKGGSWPSAATVTVYRLVGGTRVPFTATARWTEFAQTDREGKPNQMWSRMPRHMLAKCAEALALRKAFPVELGDTYIPEELPDHIDTISPAPPPEPVKLGADNVQRFRDRCQREGLHEDQIKWVVSTATGGRTHDIAEVLASEMAAVSDAFKTAVANTRERHVTAVPDDPAPPDETVVDAEVVEPDDSGAPSAAARKKMHALFGKVLPDGSRDDRLAFCRIVTGRQRVDTTEHLTKDQVAAVIDRLERVASGNEVVERGDDGRVVQIVEAPF